jgi:hypothetical protein
MDSSSAQVIVREVLIRADSWALDALFERVKTRRGTLRRDAPSRWSRCPEGGCSVLPEVSRDGPGSVALAPGRLDGTSRLACVDLSSCARRPFQGCQSRERISRSTAPGDNAGLKTERYHGASPVWERLAQNGSGQKTCGTPSSMILTRCIICSRRAISRSQRGGSSRSSKESRKEP